MWQGGRADDGQDLAEYAIVFPVLMLLLLGIIEFGRIVYSYSAISNAAREGARFAVLPGNQKFIVDADVAKPCPGDTPIIQRVCDRALLPGVDKSRVQVTLSQQDANGQPDSDVVVVQVECRLDLLTGLIARFTGQELLLKAATTMRLE
jgi:Flp pilus assembly protein TadG